MRAHSSLDELPATLPIFPLTGAVLLPRGQLPLNIFEPRYLAMVDAALSGTRFIGMIQPTEPEEKVPTPALAKVGCAGRIVSYQESDDGHYMIVLAGICRFRINEELTIKTPFRQVRPDYMPFRADLASEFAGDFPRERLVSALKNYLSQNDLKADWRSIMNAPPEMLVNALAMLCPFEPPEKQALLEALGWSERVDTLIALLEISVATSPGNTSLN